MQKWVLIVTEEESDRLSRNQCKQDQLYFNTSNCQSVEFVDFYTTCKEDKYQHFLFIFSSLNHLENPNPF